MIVAALYLLAACIFVHKVRRTMRGKTPPAFGRDWL